jgi:hypothetical protein
LALALALVLGLDDVYMGLSHFHVPVHAVC